MTEEEQIGVADDVNSVEQSSLQVSNGEALISSLSKARTMITEEEEIGVVVEIEPVEQSWLHLPDPTKRQRRCQGNKRKRGSLEDKLPKKKTPCKRKGSKGEDSTTKTMTTSTKGPHVEQPNMAANVGMNALQVPNSSCVPRRASHPTFTEMLLGGYKV